MTDGTKQAAEIARTLGRLEGKMDGFMSAIAHQSDRLDKHEVRISALEKARYLRDGAVAAFVFLLTKWDAVLASLR